MDIDTISNVFIAKNCARTASVGAETISGVAVPIGSVQIHAPLNDAGAASGSYYGAGELVITDACGKVLDDTLTKAVAPQINVVQRHVNGTTNLAQNAIKGAKITSYVLNPYKAKSEQVTVIKGIDATLEDHEYMLKIRRLGSDNNKLKIPTVKTAYFKSGASGSTADEIIQGLVDYINLNFSNDEFMPISATADLTNDAIILTALPLPWALNKYKYQKLQFDVVLETFTATLTNNLYADLTEFTVTYPQSTLGSGSYYQVAEMEDFARIGMGINRDRVTPVFSGHPIIGLDATEFETDGVTPNKYDTVVINWENIQGNFQAGVVQNGSVLIFLPLEDNGTNQQDDIIDTLNKFVVTEFGVGSAITLSV